MRTLVRLLGNKMERSGKFGVKFCRRKLVHFRRQWQMT